ncbi:MAG TPA: DUF5939 domain-containing protein, partial [Minicystis sp.]|nr:DUF5939 domain-containing protein [Minicystis sp.]
DLRASPEALWPYVANTDRFNKAAGLGEVVFVETPAEGGGATTTGSFKTLGMSIAWDEHPFEWVKDREHSVYREYTQGPLRALWNHVRLAPRDEGGTRLVHEVRAIPGGVVGRLAAQLELQMKLTRRFDEVYRRLDASLAEGAGFSGDPFEPPHAPSTEEHARVADAAERLVDRHDLRPTLVRRLADLLLHAPAKALERLRPWALADAWREPRADVLDMMLLAAGAGLLTIAWDLVGPRCQVSHEVASSLRSVSPKGVCAACNAAYEADLASSVELVFVPHATVRATDTATYCVGAPARRPHVLAQQVLAPGEERAISVVLPDGAYRVAGPRIKTPRDVYASPVGWANDLGVEVQDDWVEASPLVVRAGPVVVRLANATDKDQVIRIESTAPRSDAVTAATALAHPRFRELFSTELLAYGQHVAVSRAAFLFLDAPGRFGLLEERGDAGALAAAARLDALVAEHAATWEGAVVESRSDFGQVAAFTSPARAVQAALAVVAAAQRDVPGLAVRAAVHEGPCIALTRGEKIDWFGDTLTRGAALLEEVAAGAVALSFRVAEDRDALAALHAAGALTDVVEGRSAGYRGRRVVRVLRWST